MTTISTEVRADVPAQVERVLKPIQQFTRGWMLNASVCRALAAELGLRNDNDLWIVGRAGVMGDCTWQAAQAGLGFVGPRGVQAAWQALPTGLAPTVIARRFAELCTAWGTAELNRFEPARMERLDELGRRIADAAPSFGPVFAGWRAMPAPDDLGARVALTGHVLRELRGAAHLCAVLACGITPLEAILASPAPAGRSGPPWAEHNHWVGPFRDPDEVRPARMRAEALTSEMLHPVYTTLSAAELDEFAELIETTRNAIDM
jgi:hypothetical protein